MFLVIFDRLLLTVFLFDLSPFDHLSSDKLLYDNDIHKSFEIQVLGKVLRIIHKICSISQLQGNISDDKWSKGNRSKKKTANNNRSNITKNMKKKVDPYYCFPMANNWEIYFNSAFYSADVILGLEL